MTNFTFRRGAALMLASVIPAAHSSAQLTPDRTYYGVDRAIPMHVTVPDSAGSTPALRLYAVGTKAPVASAPAASGPVNLATLFPMLWKQPKPAVLYAQLVVGERELGAPVVLQPMLSPKTAVLLSNATKQAFWYDDEAKKASIETKDAQIVYYSESPIVFSGWRAYADVRVVLDTTAGEMEFAMRPDAAPNTAWNFVQLAQGGFYTDIVFHRVVPLDRSGKPFVIQVGDPTGTGDGNPGFSYDLEPSTLPHDFGVISVARDTEPNTNGSQIFVCLSREGTARLDGKYTAFGQLVRGTEAVRSIAATPLIDGTDKPRTPPVLRSARVVPAPPMSERGEKTVEPAAER